MRTGLKERDVETLIDNELKNLDWNDNPRDSRNCNVFKQRVKTQEQAQALQGKRPDYVLYQNNCDTPLAVIEAKKPHQDIYKAQAQAIDYAQRINASIVYATDGIFTKTYHIKKDKPLYLNNEEVDETQNKKVIESRDALIKIFKKINESLRDAGIKAGLDRINLLSNMLFLKIISELHAIDDKVVNLPPEDYLWDKFKNKKGLDLLDFLNKQAFDHFQNSYGGEVLSKIEVLSGKECILNQIIDELDDLWLSDTNTDIKGDAFEFFLRNYGGAETDFGEYFTPRHIVKTLVKLLNPCFGEKIYHPFCGTGGMLIENFKHIKRTMSQNNDTIQKLKEHTVYGGEITTMDRIAKMNMILAGDGHSNIKRQDSYEQRKINEYDVVITNIPFGSKMKTKYLGNYGFQGTSAEIAGVLHCLDAMNDKNDNARSGILIPEGILFNSSKGYTALRKKLIEQHNIENIVSLPQGVFTDAGVKSNILIVKKKQNKQKKHIWYFNVKSDGYSLDKARRPVEQNDFNILKAENDLSLKELERLEKIGFQVMYKEDVRNNKYILLPNGYCGDTTNSKFEMVKLGCIIDICCGDRITKRKDAGTIYSVYGGGGESFKTDNFNRENELVISRFAMSNKCVRYVKEKFWLLDSGFTILVNEKYKTNVDIQYIYRILFTMQDAIYKCSHGVAQKNIDFDLLHNIKIPLPPLEVQEQIVAEIEAEERTIEANKVLITKMEERIKSILSMKNNIIP